MSVRRDFPDLPPVWAAGTAVVQAALAWLLPLAGFEATWLAGLLAATGIGLVAWAALWFHRKRTTIEPRERPVRLIVEGPFRINRNPIYTGMWLLLLGWGVWLGAVSALVPPLLFPSLIARRFIAGEEASLREAFGAEADRYIARTRRW